MADLKEYFTNAAWDILCCLLVSIGLTVNVFAGYDSPDPKTGNLFLITLVCAAVTALLFLAGYTKRTVIAGLITGAVLVLAAIVYVRTSGALAGDGYIDASPALFWMVTIATTTVSYLLARRRPGIVVLLLAGAILIAAFCFLEYPVHFIGFLLFLAGTLVLFLNRVYNTALFASYTGHVRFHRFGLQSTAMALAVMLVAGGLYQGIIVPLHPPTRDLKLITVLQSFEILEKLGVSRPTEVPLEDNQTQLENDDTETSNEQTQDDQDTSPQEEMDDTLEGDMQQQNSTVEAMGIRYDQRHFARYILLGILLVLLLAAPFALKVLQRRRWEERVRQAGPTEGSVLLFNYLLKKLRYAGFTRPAAVPLTEYVEGQRQALAAFASETADMETLARDYQRVVYGYRSLDEESFARFWSVYEAFRGNLKRSIGTLRYAGRFFML